MKMHPYRAPQDPPKPPGDPMRVVIWIAGIAAAVIAIAAVALRASEMFPAKQSVSVARAPEPLSLFEPSTTASMMPLMGDPVLRHVDAGPPTPQTFPEGPYTFTASASACLGECVPHTTIIDIDGQIIFDMGRSPGNQKCAREKAGKVSRSDLDALTLQAQSIHMETMPRQLVHMRDIQRFTTTVEGSDHSLSVMHLHVENDSDASTHHDEVAAIDALHRRIEQLAGTEHWLKTCKHPPPSPGF